MGIWVELCPHSGPLIHTEWDLPSRHSCCILRCHSDHSQTKEDGNISKFNGTIRLIHLIFKIFFLTILSTKTESGRQTASSWHSVCVLRTYPSTKQTKALAKSTSFSWHQEVTDWPWWAVPHWMRHLGNRWQLPPSPDPKGNTIAQMQLYQSTQLAGRAFCCGRVHEVWCHASLGTTTPYHSSKQQNQCKQWLWPQEVCQIPGVVELCWNYSWYDRSGGNGCFGGWCY